MRGKCVAPRRLFGGEARFVLYFEAMNLGLLLTYFQTSPTIALLRAQHAPYVISFLHEQFKRSGSVVVPHSELHASCAAWLDDLQESHANAPRDRPDHYLTAWCAGDSRWLVRRFAADQDEPMYELSPYAEQALSFLDEALEQSLGFVATESRLQLVIDTLQDLVVGASADPAVHLARLRDEKERIEQQIALIQEAGVVSPYHPTRIRERFATAVSLLRQLQGDFRSVEERFRQIAHEVQRRQSGSQESRGEILGDALDAEDTLKREDQGVSFFEFLRFIHSPAQQERVRDIIRQLAQIEGLAEQSDGLEAVGRMVPSLLVEAEKVTQTTRRLSTTLRRLLDVQSFRERRRIAELLQEIRSLMAESAENPPRGPIGLEFDNTINIECPLARSFWSEPTQFEDVNLLEQAADDSRRLELFRELARLHRIDWRRLRSRVAELVAERGEVTLAALLAAYPPESGVIDILGYLQIAADDGHAISHEAVETFMLPASQGGRPRCVSIPLVTFVTKGPS